MLVSSHLTTCCKSAGASAYFDAMLHKLHRTLGAVLDRGLGCGTSSYYKLCEPLRDVRENCSLTKEMQERRVLRPAE